MVELNENIVFVQGAMNGAVYAFRTGKVYSVNDKACEIINRYINQTDTQRDQEYLANLYEHGLISKQFSPRPFKPVYQKDRKLEMAWLEITELCNLRCLHCYEGNEHKKMENSLSLAQWYDVIDQLASLKIKRLIIIGGEPCCNPNVADILEYAAQYPIDITLFTNATCFTERLFTCIIKNHIKVKISIYGHCAEIHDSITTVPGSFAKMERTIKRLINNGVPVFSAVIIMKENQEYLNQIIEYVKSIGVKYTRYDVIRQVYGGNQCAHIPTDTKIIDDISFTAPNFSTSKESFNQFCFCNSCWYGKIAVCENGDILPCEFERDIIYGNVTKESIADIIASENTGKYWGLALSLIDECKECEYRFACHDCRPLSKAANGNLFSKNPRCWYDVANGVWQKDEHPAS